MALRDEFSEEEELVLERGTPTVTFNGGGREVMIPWISFRHGLKEKGRIRLYFQGWIVELNGCDLENFWDAIQNQSVRSFVSSEVQGKGDASNSNTLSITPA